MADELAWLMDWYVSQCDGDWEHRFGLEIGTLDNPGWSLAIDLAGTPWRGRSFERVSHNLTEEEAIEGPTGDKHWWVASIEDGAFKAFGGPRDLPAMIALFRDWILTSDV
jgi:immunity protein 53 of polymorphic toxin system